MLISKNSMISAMKPMVVVLRTSTSNQNPLANTTKRREIEAPRVISSRSNSGMAKAPLTWHSQVRPRLERFSWLTLRSEEHTSELQSLMRISYAVFCLKKKNQETYNISTTNFHMKYKLYTKYNHT